jgi:site-specific DNA-methyltransferase (adenine-specific)
MTVWGVPSDGPNWGRITGNNDERRHLHKNQLPEVYLERLILAYTDPMDSILDPFGGSGTTATVGTALNRACTTIELSENYCKSIETRIKKGVAR